VRAAIAAADPARLVARALASQPFELASSAMVIAAGKAANGMLAAFGAVAGRRLRGGVLASADRPAALPAGIEWERAAHPIPGEGSARAAARALELAAASRTEGADLVVLVSGGASAMLCLPAAGLSLADKAETTRLMLGAACAIHEINAVRKHLSAIKGGRLAAAAGPTHTLAISDVVGPVEDDPAVIGSGPSTPDETTYADAMQVLERHDLIGRVPEAVRRHLEAGTGGEIEETIKRGDKRLRGGSAQIVGSRRDAMEGARHEARARGYEVLVIDEAIVGEARAAGPALVARARAAAANRPFCVVASGETTVHVKGPGRGGRNLEVVLSAVRALAESDVPLALASAGTDGVDGPTDAAGAVADDATLARSAHRGLGAPEWALDENDSYTFFDALEDLIRTGPTGTNVGDIHVVLAGESPGTAVAP
jgi:hydroxypyruvate reductase